MGKRHKSRKRAKASAVVADEPAVLTPSPVLSVEAVEPADAAEVRALDERTTLEARLDAETGGRVGAAAGLQCLTPTSDLLPSPLSAAALAKVDRTPTPVERSAGDANSPIRWKGMDVTDEFRAYAEQVAAGADLPPYRGAILKDPGFPWHRQLNGLPAKSGSGRRVAWLAIAGAIALGGAGAVLQPPLGKPPQTVVHNLLPSPVEPSTLPGPPSVEATPSSRPAPAGAAAPAEGQPLAPPEPPTPEFDEGASAVEQAPPEPPVQRVEPQARKAAAPAPRRPLLAAPAAEPQRQRSKPVAKVAPPPQPERSSLVPPPYPPAAPVAKAAPITKADRVPPKAAPPPPTEQPSDAQPPKLAPAPPWGSQPAPSRPTETQAAPKKPKAPAGLLVEEPSF